jgi:hypothetical protein
VNARQIERREYGFVGKKEKIKKIGTKKEKETKKINKKEGKKCIHRK